MLTFDSSHYLSTLIRATPTIFSKDGRISTISSLPNTQLGKLRLKHAICPFHVAICPRSHWGPGPVSYVKSNLRYDNRAAKWYYQLSSFKPV